MTYRDDLRCQLGIFLLSGFLLLAPATSDAAGSMALSQGGWSRSTQVTINWTGSGLASGAWIGVYAVGSADTAYLNSKSISGTSGVVTFGLLANGNYEARLFADGFYSLKQATVAFAVATPTGSLSLSSSAVKVGSSVTVTWQSQPGITSSGWVGVYTPEAGDNNYLISIPYQYVAAGTGGSLTFSSPNTVGSYEFRLFADYDFTVRLAAASFTVANPVGSVAAASSSYASGDTVAINWTADTTLPSGAWVGIYAPGSEDRSYVTYKQVAGTSGSATFTGLANGSYESRLFGDSGFDRKLATSSFSVSASTGQGTSTGTTAKSDCLLNWAEASYPTLFAPKGFQSISYGPYYLRYYSATNAYLAITSSSLVYLGPLSGNQLADL